MKKFILYSLIFLLSSKALLAQDAAAEAAKNLEKAKAEMKRNRMDLSPDYNQAVNLLQKVVAVDSLNAEAWYYYGYALDRLNSFDGETMLDVDLVQTAKASDAFQKSITLSDSGIYKGEILLLDPHTKILTAWGSQAYRYFYENKRDSAEWCLRQAFQRGGVNRIVLDYFRQVVDECSPGAYLFTNGDLYLYYLIYLQVIERYRVDVRFIDLNLLNTRWYPAWLQTKGVLNVSYSADELAKVEVEKWVTKEISINNKNDKYGDSVITWQLKPTYANKFILRSDKIILNLLQKNSFEKEVFFAGDVPTNMSLFLDTYLQPKGLTDKMVTHPKGDNTFELELRLKNLQHISTESRSYLDNKDNIQLLNNYRFAYATAAIIASQNNHPEKALEFLESAERKYTEDVLPYFAQETKDYFADLKNKAAKGEKLQ
jgi:tetratricopeptide (TPR) repeat protein